MGGVLVSSRSSCSCEGLLASVERRCEGLFTINEDKLLSFKKKDWLSTATKLDHRNLLYQ